MYQLCVLNKPILIIYTKSDTNELDYNHNDTTSRISNPSKINSTIVLMIGIGPNYVLVMITSILPIRTNDTYLNVYVYDVHVYIYRVCIYIERGRKRGRDRRSEMHMCTYITYITLCVYVIDIYCLLPILFVPVPDCFDV